VGQKVMPQSTPLRSVCCVRSPLCWNSTYVF